MIRSCAEKKREIISKITSDISPINDFFGEGYGKSGYLELINQREKITDIGNFLNEETAIQMLYKTLAEWRMNRRGARLKEYSDFKKSLIGCIPILEELEQNYEPDIPDFNQVQNPLKTIYNKMHVMKSRAKFVSNAKILHFLFPRMLTPMDRSYTLKYFYGGSDGTVEKYLEIIKFTFSVMNDNRELKSYLDPHWNTTIPKMIDNAVILVVKDRELIRTKEPASLL